LKNRNFSKSHKLRLPKSKERGRWGRRATELGDFWKFVTKI